LGVLAGRYREASARGRSNWTRYALFTKPDLAPAFAIGTIAPRWRIHENAAGPRRAVSSSGRCAGATAGGGEGIFFNKRERVSGRSGGCGRAKDRVPTTGDGDRAEQGYSVVRNPIRPWLGNATPELGIFSGTRPGELPSKPPTGLYHRGVCRWPTGITGLFPRPPPYRTCGIRFN